MTKLKAAAVSTLSLLFTASVVLARPPARPAPTKSSAPGCGNEILRKAMRLIDSACPDLRCARDKVRTIDENLEKKDFLAAISDPSTLPLFLFFPDGKSDLSETFNWELKKPLLDRLGSMDLTDRTIYLVGGASHTGGAEYNLVLSTARMTNTMDYLNSLGIKCREIKGGAVGKDALRLNLYDATALRLLPSDYRNPTVLNQHVLIFTFCSDLF